MKNKTFKSRTEFSGLNDLMQYIVDKDKEEQRLKKSTLWTLLSKKKHEWVRYDMWKNYAYYVLSLFQKC